MHRPVKPPVAATDDGLARRRCQVFNLTSLAWLVGNVIGDPFLPKDLGWNTHVLGRDANFTQGEYK